MRAGVTDVTYAEDGGTKSFTLHYADGDEQVNDVDDESFDWEDCAIRLRSLT